MIAASGVVQQTVQLIQVSANTRTLCGHRRVLRAPWTSSPGPSSTTSGRCSSKSSWRANDWMWGRVDGAGWLVHVLLDPRRVIVIVEADTSRFPPLGSWRQHFLDELAVLTHAEPPDNLDELLDAPAYLDDEELPMPRSLPATALWLLDVGKRGI